MLAKKELIENESVNNCRAQLGLGVLDIKVRSCLYCGIKFESRSASNRKCHQCKNSQSAAQIKYKQRKGAE